MANYTLINPETQEILKVRKMDREVAEILNEERMDGFVWKRGLTRKEGVGPRPKSIAPLLRFLDIEGFNEHTMNNINRFLAQEAKDLARGRERRKEAQSQWSAFMREQSPEIRKMAGRFISMECGNSFAQGIRVGLGHRLMREEGHDQPEA